MKGNIDNIQILGLNEFNDKEQSDVMEFSMKYYEKIKRDLQGILKIHAKKHDKTGERSMFSFHAKVQTPNNVINVRDSDWDLHKALHKVLRKVENQVKHKFKSEGK
jgi:ribosome-associated translation inhibitor RaiA